MAFVGVVGFTNTAKKFNYIFLLGWFVFASVGLVLSCLVLLLLCFVGLLCVFYSIIILI